MILVDVNLWIYAYNDRDERHRVAKRWLEDILSSEEVVLVPWMVIVGFVRIIGQGLARQSKEQIKTIVDDFLDTLHLPNILLPELGVVGLKVYTRLLHGCDAIGTLSTDAYLAAVALDHGARLASNDQDFSRFMREGLEWFNPLEIRETRSLKPGA